MLQKVARVRRWLRAQSRAQLGYHVATGLLLVLGVVFRSRRYWIDPIGLWGDEASWARRLFHASLTDFEFRPLGYMDLTRLAVHIYCDERTIRILSYVAGLASLVLVLDIGRYLFRSRSARLLCLAVIAFHPLLIDMAREFKPYSVEFCAHLGLVWLFLRWRASATRGRFCALLLCSALTFLFAYNIVFVLPAIFGLLGVRFSYEKAYRRLLVTVLAACATLALIAGVYFGLLRQMGSSDDSEKFWGGKYDVFYLADTPNKAPQSRASWLAHKYVDLIEFPDVQRSRWVFPESVSPGVSSALVAVSYYAWLALHAVGLVSLFLRGRREWLVLLVTPILLVMAFNGFGLWPFGVFRANTFLLSYYALIPLVGLDALTSWVGRFGPFVAAAGYLLIVLPNLTVGFDSHGRKNFFTGQSEARTVLRRLKALRERAPMAARQEKSYVLLDWYSCAPFEFETSRNDSTRREFGRYLLDNFDFECTRTPRGMQGFMRKLRGKSFFVVVTDDRAKPATRNLLQKETTLLDEEQVRGTHDLYYATGN